MARVLVTGAGGGLGSNVVAQARARGHEVRALVRDPSRARFGAGVEVVKGDALDSDSVTAALEGCGALYHLANIAIGKDWVDVTARLLEAAIAAARRTGARLVFPANVWIYGRGRPDDLVDETREPSPCSELGRARAAKEARLRTSGVRFTMVRLPEFYGPHVQTLTGPPLQRIARGQRGFWFGPPDVGVELVFMPDAARVLLDVGLADGVDGETFHCPGPCATTPRQFFAEAIRAAGVGAFAALPPLAVRAAALVSPLARSFADILHLWEAPVLLDGRKLARRFPDLRSTPYTEGLATTLAWLRAHPDARMYF